MQMKECQLLENLNKAKERDGGHLRDLAFAVEALGRPGIAQDPNALKMVLRALSCVCDTASRRLTRLRRRSLQTTRLKSLKP